MRSINNMKSFGLTALAALLSMCAWAQGTVTGTVTGENNEPLVGAVVVLTGTYQGVATDVDGKYRITLPQDGSYELTVSFIGYDDFSLPVSVTGGTASGGDVNMTRASYLTDEVTITATRADSKTPTANATMDKEDIAAENLGQDMPYVMRMQPSVVVTSDAGAGVGYTGIRIRGSDATRVNVTINGIPYNDAESQGVF